MYTILYHIFFNIRLQLEKKSYLIVHATVSVVDYDTLRCQVQSLIPNIQKRKTGVIKRYFKKFPRGYKNSGWFKKNTSNILIIHFKWS